MVDLVISLTSITLFEYEAEPGIITRKYYIIGLSKGEEGGPGTGIISDKDSWNMVLGTPRTKSIATVTL